MSQVILEVQNLKKYFKTPAGMLHAVDDVSFQLEQGKTLGVVGESGCGKSTMGRVILQLLKPTDGKILFDGQDITNAGKKQLLSLHRNMQMIFQDPFSSLNPRMSVSQIIAEPLFVHKVCASKQEYQQRVSELMEVVGLAKRFENAYPHELDGGRRQRIGVARAIALRPKFIVCDEPVSALDVSIQAQILNLMMDLQQSLGLTYLFISHDLSVVKHISDDICVMYLGNLVGKSPSDRLFERALHPYTKALLSAIPIAKLGENREEILLKGEITSPIEPKPGCRFAPRCMYAKEKCFTDTPVLEQVEENHCVACHFARELNGLQEQQHS